MSIIPLSENEKAILEYIEEFMTSRGISPSYKEIKDNFGYASYNSVQRYLKQLSIKGYVSNPGGNQKRALTLLRPASALKRSLKLAYTKKQIANAVSTPTKAPDLDRLNQGSLALLPLLGCVAAGRPIEALHHEEFTEVPNNMVQYPQKSYTLEVRGNSMIEDGIFHKDTLIVQEQKNAANGTIAICIVDNEATVKRFYLHQDASLARPQVELRPANSEMDSMWYSPEQVEIRGIVIGLLRKF
jgi:repressor LexA